MTEKELIRKICRLRALENKIIEEYANEHPTYKAEHSGILTLMHHVNDCKEEEGYDYYVKVDCAKLAYAIQGINDLRESKRKEEEYKQRWGRSPYDEPRYIDGMTALCERLGVPNTINMRDFGY